MNSREACRPDLTEDTGSGWKRAVDLTVSRVGFDVLDETDVSRSVAVEEPVAIEVCGIGYAVMMATPADLHDFAVGFTLAEGLANRADEIASISTHDVEGGTILRIELAGTHRDRVFERARTRLSESSCGLCGMENIEEVLRPLPPVIATIHVNRAALAKALVELPDHQPLNHATGAVHAAAFCTPDGAILAAREDIGRHNALDKLMGAMVGRGIDPKGGFILLSSRCSYELVEKTVRAGCPMLVTISAPTSLAAKRARDAGLALVSLARSDSALVICDPQGVVV